ncbi:MAG: PAS domain S-box protein [Roseiflexaceae bacterium]|nr:PAS domain S-box protein [Roseiflexaceae bacterium]
MRTSLQRYSCAVLSIMLATWVRLLLDPIVGLGFPFTTLFFAVLFTAWYGGFGAAVAAATLGTLCSAYFVLPPRGTFAVTGLDQQAGLVLYLFTSLGIALLGGSMHTARRRAEASAQAARQHGATSHASQERLAGIIGSAMDAIISINAAQRIVVFNTAAEHMFGCAAATAISQPIDRFIPPKFRSTHDGHVRAFGQTGVTSRSMGSLGMLTAVHMDGREFPIEATISQTVAAGQPLYTVIMRDISVRTQAEAALRESEERLRTVTNSARVGLVIVDEQHHYRYANRAYADMFHLPTADIVGQRVADVLAPVYDTQIRPHLEHAFRGERVNYELVVPPATADQQACSYVVTYEPGMYRSQAVVIVMVVDITERQHTEEQLRYHASLLAQVSDAIIATDMSFTIKSWNAAAEALYGWQSEEVIGKKMAEILPTTYQDTDDLQVIAAFLHDGRWQGEVTQPHSDGTQRSILSGVRLLKDSTGIPVGAVAVNRDISERKRAEQALQRAADRLRVLADASRTFAEVGTDYQTLLDQIARTITAGLGEGCTIRLLSDDGMWLNLAVLYDQDSQKLELTRIVIDQALLRVDEASLISQTFQKGQARLIPILSQEQLHALAEPQHWPLVDDLGMHSLMIVPMRVQGQTIGVLTLSRNRPEQPPFDDDDLTLAQDLADRAALAISNVRLLTQVQHELAERTKAEAEVRILSVELEQRVIERTAELTAANKELEAFSYSVSHDLRAPLRAIDGFSRILLEDYIADLPAEAQHYFQLVRDNAQKMGHLVDDLLAFARLSRQPLNKRSVDPTLLVQQCLEELRAEQTGRQISIEIGELPACQADSILLKQVWINLIANALKYTRRRDPAIITIGSRSDGIAVVYFIQDNGVGFDMRYSDKLFGVFQRMHRAEDYAGTGVGLAIVQRIIHRHGGRIWADAVVDHGATFFFTLGDFHDRAEHRDPVG